MNGVDADLLCNLPEVTKSLLVKEGIKNFLLVANGCCNF